MQPRLVNSSQFSKDHENREGSFMPHVVRRAQIFGASLTLSAAALIANPALAETAVCDRGLITACGRSTCAQPATPAPASLWGELQPADTGQLPPERDTTDFNEFTTAYYSRNWFYGVDVENGWVLAGLAHGIGVWDARSSQAVPTFLALRRYSPGLPGAFPFIPGGESSKIVFGGIDAPAGVDRVAALAGYNGAGILVFDLADKNGPRPVYQNAGKTSESVYAARIGSTNYAFLAAQTPPGVFVYDLDRAIQNQPTSNDPGCLQDDANSPNDCPGVFKGSFPGLSSANFVHGAGNLVAVGHGASKGLSIWDVSNPSAAIQRGIVREGPGGYPIYGVAMWQNGGQTYAAARLGVKNLGGGNLSPEQIEIYNVSACASGPCAPTLVGNFLAATGGQSQYLTVSFDGGGKPFLYLGSDASCALNGGATIAAREFLLDVSNPAAPVNISPSSTTPITATYNDVSVTKNVNYWSWYDREGPSGFNLVAPRVGKFNGDNFYRAARSIFDFHKKSTPSPPTANFTWTPSDVYPGVPVQFSDSSSGAPNQWAWAFTDGAPGTSAAQNPSVSFSSVGSKPVTLTATNGQGPSTPVTKNVNVLSPAPAIGAVSASPVSPLVCQPVTLSATGVTGQPTLSYAWNVLNPSSSSVFTSTSVSPVWSTVGMAPGNYTATLTVNNTIGPAAQKSTAINLGALAPLPTSFAPTADPFTAGSVQFHVSAAGATEWNWDFGDGLGYRGWTNDPVTGPNPTVVYTSTGNKTVRVKVRNCVESEKTSSDLVINILITTPLHAEFRLAVFCTGFGCLANVNQTIDITDLSTGAEKWDYDWNGDGSYEDANNSTPRANHTFSTVGTFSPKLRVRRGVGEEHVFTHISLTVSSANPPAVSISGPSSAAVGAAAVFTASASNCTPNPTGWTWGVDGGTGSSTNSTISITWAASGTKTVTVSNSGCSGTSASRSISIGGGGGGGGTLASSFVFTPAAPKSGEAVTFNGAASTGSPTTYEWSFGDGSPLVTGGASSTAHAFAQPGSYLVRLTVTKPGTGAGCQFGICFAESFKTVVVQTSEPPLTASIDTSAACESTFVGILCRADAGVPINFTAVAPGATGWNWTFGDGSTPAQGASVVHTFAHGGDFTVQLVATKGLQIASASRFFAVEDRPKSVAVPWIGQNPSPNQQTTDLYINNHSVNALPVNIYFRRRGTPVANPPKVARSVPARGTILVTDVLQQLFTEPNNSGFIVVEVGPGLQTPVVTAVHSSIGTDGLRFTQTVRGVTIDASALEASGDLFHVIGLSDTAEKDSYFGLTNIGNSRVEVRLEFFDQAGALLATSATIGVPRFGQRVFNKAELRDQYEITGKADYRVEIEVLNDGDVLPFGSTRLLPTADPSLAPGVAADNAKLYLLGATDSVSRTAPVWQTDLVISNPAPVAQTATLRFVEAGGVGRTSPPVTVNLAAGETKRLVDAVSGAFGAAKRTGMVILEGGGAGRLFPLITGEVYDNFAPAKRYGQILESFSEREAADIGHSVALVGLRQDAAFTSTFWVAGVGSERAEFTLLFRDFEGNVLKTMANQGIGAGKVKQYASGVIPAAPNGLFTIEVLVTKGKAIAAGQVTGTATKDPAYVKGQVY
jgi:PKD repeat protein